MTAQETHTQHVRDLDSPDTEVFVVQQPAPVFVDSTGRRRRMLRRFSYAFGACCMVYGGLVSVSLAGGPVSPRAVLPVPELIPRTEPRTVHATPTASPRPRVTAQPPVLLNEAMPGREAGRRQPERSASGQRWASRPPATTRTSKGPAPTARASEPPAPTIRAPEPPVAGTGARDGDARSRAGGGR